MDPPSLDQYRYFLKDTIRQRIDFSQTDQRLGVEMRPVEKPAPDGAKRLDLPSVEELDGIQAVDLRIAVGNRRSRRTISIRGSRTT